MDGIFNINKSPGMTSHDVVARIRKLLKQKRVGHAGTLDPTASGVLPICVGQGTRVAEYLSESGKAYRAEIIFGIVTDTYDSEGTVIRTANTENLSLPEIEETLQRFIGPQLQCPPRYSAIKVQGQPAYKLARAGEDISLAPRSITIYQLKIANWLPPRLTLDIECSKGTYIRSLAYDLGEQLNCGAYLATLIRTRSGPFSLPGSITLEQLAGAMASGIVEKYLYPPDTALKDYPALQLDATTVERVQHGNAFKFNQEQIVTGPLPSEEDAIAPLASPSSLATPLSLARVYDTSGHLLAIAEWDAQQELWQPKKVFVPS